MNWKVKFSTKANTELLNAIIWYDEQSLGLGKKFEIEIINQILLIESNPFLFAIKKKQFRTALLNNFPYLIVFYILKTEKEVLITSIFHTSKNPTKKFKTENKLHP
jgi:hypothetical protein